MILSVSRRTDIPAFYSDWFFNRIREGFVYVRNPMNAHQVSRVAISPETVDCIVFWSKNPAPMLDRLDELKGYDYYFQYTVNNYGKEAEPNIPTLETRLKTFAELSERIGRERVIWRYDPILFSDIYTAEYHLKSFSHIAERLRGYTEKCVFSLVDVYASKNRSSLMRLREKKLSPKELDGFLKNMADTAKENGLALASCAENISAEKYGIVHNSCIDKALIERITGSKLSVKSDGQRPNCQCVKCDDIGSYDTCSHGCVYCYANYRPKTVEEKSAHYDVNLPLLCDRIDEKNDIITDRPVRSYKQKGADDGSDGGADQLTLF
ncbi:MAG: DUF1848 domain-containing protein [Firmicutes bacterium]|nr:DUF1848 domain-containing protein [[Eubacterium] siraeum]MCM1488040.1 DUF1848 domain-containing protein [Bacillota bacterium]